MRCSLILSFRKMESGIYLIGEIGQAHEGSLGLAHSYIDALAGSGINAVKFQVHITDAESSKHEQFRTAFSYLNETRMEYWKRMEFTPEQWLGLKTHCELRGLEFIATPSSVTAARLLTRMNVQRFKIGSGDTTNFLLLNHLGHSGKEMILSSGMSSISELDTAIAFLNKYSNKISVLQCTSSYPTQPAEWGLNVIQELKNRYRIPVGFSDHSGDIFACLAACTLGAEILEFHVAFDQRMFGPDSHSSITIDQVTALTRGVRQIETALRNPVNKSVNSAFTHVRNIFGKSLSVNKNLPKGHPLALGDLESKKPAGLGIPVENYYTIIGRQLNKDLDQWAFLTENDLL
jgi:N,N'-diacetyllegionaminate synthase